MSQGVDGDHGINTEERSNGDGTELSGRVARSAT